MRLSLFSITLLSAIMASGSAGAQTLPYDFTVEGRLYTAAGAPLGTTTGYLRLELLSDVDTTCVLFREDFTAIDLSGAGPGSASEGVFAMRLGSGSKVFPTGAISLPTLFKAGSHGGNNNDTTVSNCTSVATASHHPLVRVRFNTTGGPVYETLSPDTRVTAVPTAMVADSANTLQGKDATSFILTNVSSSLVQTNVENVFSSTNYTKLLNLLSGAAYIPATPTAPVGFNNQRLTGVADPTGAQDAATKNYADTFIGGKTIDSTGVSLGVGGGKTLVWDQILNKWVAQTISAGVSSVVAGAGLVGGTISSVGTLSVDVGTTGNKIVQLVSGKLPAVDGSTLTNIQFPVTSVNGKSGGAVTLIPSDIAGFGTAALKDYGTATGNLVELAGASRLPALDGFALSNLNAIYLQSRRIASTAPMTGQVLTWNGSQWEPQAAAVSGITDLYGDVTAIGPGNVNAVIGNDKITSAKISTTGNVANRLLITDATTGATVTYATCLTGEILKYNVGTGWGCAPDSTGGTVNLVAAGSGLTGGAISNSGTLSVDTGTTANQILQLNGAAQIPAVDGSLVKNIDAVALRGFAVSSTSPTPSQVLAWNGSAWVPSSASTGTVTSIAAGSGLLGGTFTTGGTLSVDTGVGANQILKLNGSAQIPAVDGFLVSNVNSVKLQGRNVAVTAPTASQVLGWNNTISAWEPVSPGSGTVTSVAAGSGLLGGTFTNGGTLSVDTGVGANQILKLNGSAQIPSVDGFLVSNVNSVKLQARDVASTAPIAGQLLGWNATVSAWEPTTGAAGSMTGVVSGTGLVAGAITSYGTLNVDVGVGANKIVQLTAGAQYPAVDGALITNVNSVRLQGRDVAATAPTASQVLGWNNTISAWEPTNPGTGTVASVAAGSGLLGGTFTTGGTLSVDTGVGANQIVKLNGSAQIPAVDAYLLTNLNVTKLQNRALSSAAPVVTQVLAWNGSQWQPADAASGTMLSVSSGTGLLGGTFTTGGTLSVDVGVGANKILQLTAVAQIPAVDGFLVTNVNAVKIQARDVASTPPTAGQLLGWNATVSAWEPTTGAAGSMTGVVSGAGLVAGAITSYGTLNVDVGVGANKIVQLTAGAQYPAVDGALITNVNSVRLQGRDIAATAPTASQVLGWNNTISAWEPTNPGTGTVASVAAGSGLLGGTFTTGGTLSVDTGVGAFKILQLNASAQIPAVDGFLVSNVNSVKLQNRNVSNTAPGAGQLLGWNATVSAWEPTTGAAGSLTGVVSGAGLVAGAISSYGTINVDVGTTANQILQLNGSAQIPAVDGSLIKSVNAVSLRGFPVSSTGPTPSQVLAWNGTAWAPSAASTGTVTSVAAGSGLLGGTFTTGGTLAVDIGTTSGKILQLNASAQIPGVDGFLVSNVNARKIQSRDVATTAPAAGQFLGWNATVSAWEPTTGAAGDFMANGSVPMTGSFNALAGTAALPGISFVGDTNNGIYRPAADQIGFTTNGTERMRIDALGNVGIGLPSPAYALDVNSWINSNTGYKLGGNNALSSPGANDLAVGPGALYSNSSGTFNVGVGPFTLYSNTTGSYNTAVGDHAGFGGGGTVNNSTLVGYSAGADLSGASNNILIGYEAGNLLTSGSGNLLIGHSAQPGVGGVTATNQLNIGNMIYGNLSLKTVGIGTTAPQAILDAYGTGTLSAIIVPRDTTGNRPTGVNGMIRYNITTNKMEVFESGWQNMISAGASFPLYASPVGTAGAPAYSFSGSANTGMYSPSANTLALSTSGTQRFTVDQNGQIGIGTATPQTTLDVVGSMRLATTITNPSGSFLPGQASQVNYAPSAVSAVGANIVGAVSSVYTSGGNSTANASLTGYSANVSNSTGSVLNATGVDSHIQTTSTGAITNAYGFNSFIDPNGTGTITNAYGLYSSIGNAGPITNAYGLYIDSIGGTNNYGVYQFSAANKNYFAGSVGIGTTTPQAILDAYGTGTLSAIIVPRDSTGNRPTGVNGMIRYNNTTSKMEVFEGGWQNMISSGTSFPLMANPVGTAGAPAYTFAGDLSTGMYDVGVGTLGFATAGTARMIINSVGRIGVGSTSPRASLDVNGAILSAPATANVGGPINFATGNFQTMSTGCGGYALHNLKDGGHYVLEFLGSNSNTCSFSSYSDSGVTLLTTIMPADFTGSRPGTKTTFYVDVLGTDAVVSWKNPWITSTTQAILDVTGTGTQSSMIVPRDSAGNRPSGINGMIRYNTSVNKFEVFEGNVWSNVATSNGGNGQAFIEGGNNFGAAPTANFGTTSATNLNIVTSGVMRMSVLTSGNVGINHGTPGSALSVFGGVGIGGSAPYVNNPAPSYGLIVEGNVGVGTASPLSHLHVHSAAWGGSEVQLENTSPGGHSYVMVSTGAGSLGGAGGLEFYDVTALSSRLRVSASGSIGIGTNDPQAMLDVVGTGTGQSAMIVPRDTTANRPVGGVGAVNGMIRYNNEFNKLEAFENGQWNYVSAATGGFLNGGNNFGGAPASLGSNDLSNLNIKAGGVSRISLMSSGNVGIGSTTPNYMLDVSGSSSFAGAFYVSGGNVVIGNSLGSAVFGTTGAGATTTIRSGTNGITLQPIAGTSTSGPVLIWAGQSTAATGGTVDMYAGDAASATYAGGAVVIRSGTGNTTGAGGNLTLQTGGSGTGVSGNIYLNPGVGGGGARGSIILGSLLSSKIGVGTTTPQAILDVNGTGTGYSAMIVPRDTTANRPIGVNGMIRYNQNTNRLESFERGAWNANSPIRLATTTTASATSITLAPIAGLSAQLLAGRTYTFDITLYTTTGASLGGTRVDLAGGSVVASAVILDGVLTEATAMKVYTRASALTTVICSFLTTTTTNTCRVTGTITVGTAGTFIPRFAQNTANATASTVAIGSSMIITPID